MQSVVVRCMGAAVAAATTAALAAHFGVASSSASHSGATAGVAPTGDERRIALSLALKELPPIDPASHASNRVTFDPGARSLGAKIFSDSGFSRDASMSCATCHDPAKEHASPLLVIDPERGPRNPPSLRGVAWHEFFMSDGRKDSLWAQALAPLTSPVEHALTYDDIARRVATAYDTEYRSVFGEAPEAGTREGSVRVAVNVAKALAAFQTTLLPEEGPFDAYLASLERNAPPPPGFGECASRGLGVFLGAGRCVSCHNGPLLTNRHFHNTGVPRAAPADKPLGFFVASAARKSDPFRCDGPHSDAGGVPGACRHVEHAVDSGTLGGAFKTPTLRGISRTSPYMHNGVYGSLEDVVDHYARAPAAGNGESELSPVELGEREREALVCFLKTL